MTTLRILGNDKQAALSAAPKRASEKLNRHVCYQEFQRVFLNYILPAASIAQKGISGEKRRSCQQRARVGSHKSTSAASYKSSFLTCARFARAKIQVKSVKCGPLRIPRC